MLPLVRLASETPRSVDHEAFLVIYAFGGGFMTANDFLFLSLHINPFFQLRRVLFVQNCVRFSLPGVPARLTS